MNDIPKWKIVAICFAAFLIFAPTKGCTIPGIGGGKVTNVTYVHAARTPVPAAIQSGLDKLNAQDIIATPYMLGTTDGVDPVPDQYKLAVEASKADGVPLLVAQTKTRVVRTVKAPTTEEQVLEAAK